MTLSDISIRRPVFAWMLMLGLIVFGIISFKRMGISQLPDIDFPVLTVSVSWIGAAPEVMESAVTDIIEDAVMSVEGIRSVTSSCQEGLSSTTIEFELTRNIDVALQEVQTKIAQAQKRLPNGIDPPIVTKSNPEDQPIMWTSLTGPNSLRDKVIFIRDRLKDRLTTIEGVGDLRLGGYVDPNMRVWLNTNSLRKRELTVDDVISAISSGNTLTPSGYMDNGAKETNIRVMSEVRTPSEFAGLTFPTRSGAPIWNRIHLGEVARIESGVADLRRLSRMNGVPAIGIGVIKQRGANAVAVAEAVKKRIAEISPKLPDGMKLEVVVDSTRFIKESTRELLFTLGLAVVLTSIICYLFLGSVGSAFNVVLAIPTSLIGAFIVLYFFGFTINTFTLLALSLSIGIVVDDAIMVLENIVRQREKGMSQVKASLVGAREITGAATAASLAILAIFIPVVFMKGIIGKFFFQFGVTMSVAVLLSLLEALTLAPMRCSQFLSTGHDTWVGRRMNSFMNYLAGIYRSLLVVCLNWRWTVIAVSAVVFASSILLLNGVKKEFVPAQDQSLFLATLYTPLGSSLDFTDKVFAEAETVLKNRPEVASYMSAIGGFQGGLVSQGNMFVILKSKEDRGIKAPFKKNPTQQEFMAFLRKEFQGVKGLERASLIDLSLSGFTSSRGYPVTFSVQGPDWATLADLSDKFKSKMKETGLMTDVDSDYRPNMPELRIIPNRDRAIAHGVTVTTIANTISALVGSLQVGKYTDASGHRNDIRVKLLDEYNRQPTDINRIWVRNISGEMVPLSSVVTLEKKTSLLTIGRYNRERAITMFANVTPGASQAEAMDKITEMSKSILPGGYHIELSGNSQAFKESFQSLFVALILGIFVAYMILGAQFNSFIHPVTILLALPFSVTGAFLALWVTNISLNIYSMIGILLLMGIVKKNSILLVEFTNHRRLEGDDVKTALLDACPIRLRPILMTSVATIAAAIPAAIALGPGAETTRPMAVVVIGGVILSTFLTLLVVPCAYSLFTRLESHKHEAALKEALISLGQSGHAPASSLAEAAGDDYAQDRVAKVL